MFGWDLPPGCTLADIDESFGEHGPSCFCEDCLIDPSDEEATYGEVVAEARAEDEREECETAQLIAAMRAAVAQVPSYCGRYQRKAADLSHDDTETDILHERMMQGNPAYATSDEVRMADLYDM